MTPAVRFDAVLPPAPVLGWTDPVSFDIADGSFCVVTCPPMIAGPLLRLCGGISAPRSGSVEVLGIDASALTRRRAQIFRRQLGVGFQPGGLISNLTLRMNLIVPLLYSGAADLGDATRRADETLREASLSPWAAMRPADVPADIRQEAVIARAIVRDPALLLLEDPISSLRAARVDTILDLCRREARTIVITTSQSMPVLDQHADCAATWDDTGLTWVRHEVGTY